MSGDTIINSKSYHKFYKTGYSLFHSSTQVNTIFFNKNVYMGAIRDEDQKIYFIKKESTNEVTLYNFDLKIGNIIKSEIYKGDTVVKIDTILDNRKIFYLNQKWGDVLIEGIGCTRIFSTIQAQILIYGAIVKTMYQYFIPIWNSIVC